MLYNLRSAFPNPIDAMNASVHAFFLTGSRFFDPAVKNVDWDFFTKDTPMVRRFLREMRFSEHTSTAKDGSPNRQNYQGISDCRAVYEFNGGAPDTTIHVQLVGSAVLKANLQATIRKYFGKAFQALSHGQRAAMWRLCYDLAQNGVEQVVDRPLTNPPSMPGVSE